MTHSLPLACGVASLLLAPRQNSCTFDLKPCRTIGPRSASPFRIDSAVVSICCRVACGGTAGSVRNSITAGPPASRPARRPASTSSGFTARMPVRSRERAKAAYWTSGSSCEGRKDGAPSIARISSPAVLWKVAS
ncbi:hypothetical protein [Streptomyces scabiei]|uniref:hypothetical protein n=1 Tax=Streptomyces scabiei TaxID=1930 RepID=UPI0018FE9E8E